MAILRGATIQSSLVYCSLSSRKHGKMSESILGYQQWVGFVLFGIDDDCTSVMSTFI